MPGGWPRRWPRPGTLSGAARVGGGAFCADCRYSPKKRTGEDGCPLSALYWDFIGRNEERFASNHRMAMAVRSWNRFDPAEQAAIADRASLAREELAGR